MQKIWWKEPEINEGEDTGKYVDEPCYQGGKVSRLARWLETNPIGLTDSTFYSDSHNDIPLLEKVTHPVAVDPDDTLKKHAADNFWPIISLR